MIGDIGASVRCSPTGSRAGWRPTIRSWPSLRQNILGHINERAEDDRFPVIPQRLVHDVRAVMPEDGIVCLDNGMYKIWFARNYRTQSQHAAARQRARDDGRGAAVGDDGGKMLYPERKVMAVCGDGGFMMNSQELETAVRLGSTSSW